MADIGKAHSAVRWGKPVADCEAAGMNKETVDTKDPQNGNVALHIAAQNGHLDLVNWLITDLKCNVNLGNGKGNTALHMGVEYDYYKINKALIAAGADKDALNGEGHKALLGLEGSHTGHSAWDNPVVQLKSVADNREELDAVFSQLESAKPEDLNKEELVRTGMMRKKELKESWGPGGFQDRFKEICKKL